MGTNAAAFQQAYFGADREPVRRAYGWAERRAERAADRVSYIWPDRAAHRDPVGRAFGYAYSEPDSATDAADKDAHPDAAADRAAAADAGSGACPDVHDLDDDDQDADARPDVRTAPAAAAPAARLARDAATDIFLRLLRGAHDGADHGDVESNGDGSPDARGDVRTDARDGSAVLRADDGHLCAVGRADGHGAALAFGSADRRADDGADAADSLDGGDDDIRARRRRGTPPPHPSPAHNSTHYISRAFMLAAGKTLAIFAAHTLQSARGAALGHMQAKRWTGQP